MRFSTSDKRGFWCAKYLAFGTFSTSDGDTLKEHILPNWDKECVNSIKIGERVAVTVWDCDTKSKHQLFFNKETDTNAAYDFIGQWTEEFVSSWGMKKDDEIGLYWDQINLRFCFSILNQALSD